ncbi:MAG: hypothetical protein A2176_06345 [Spirochaetes bacterium RBG_13_51_14]|nr:MAG: hypothetical protein A2176_06345 [Spirochaetes bacterium RBG_13_51_14]
MMSATGKITSKGQITIPREIRKVLGSDVIEFEVSGEVVLLKPVKSVAGSLHAYARRQAPFAEIRDATWGSVVKDKYAK